MLRMFIVAETVLDEVDDACLTRQAGTGDDGERAKPPIRVDCAKGGTVGEV